MKDFAHKGFNIKVDSAGRFVVDSRPDLGNMPSLDEMKAVIDKALKAERTPIEALMFTGARYDSTHDGIAVVTVTSTQPGRWGGGGDAWIKTKSGARSKESTSSLYLNTPENMATMQEVVKLSQEAKRLRDRVEKMKLSLKTIRRARRSRDKILTSHLPWGA